MQWMKLDDTTPKKGHHTFMIGQNEDGTQWLWWGFYNPEREDGQPNKPAIYWCKMPPLPIMPEIKKETPCVNDVKILGDLQKDCTAC